MKKKKKEFKNIKFNRSTRLKFPINKKLFKGNVKTNSWFRIKLFTPDKNPAQNRKHIFKLNRKGKIKTKTRSRKIRIVFNQEQRNKIIQWLSVYRKVYNLAVKTANNHKIYNFINLRKIVKPLYQELYGRKIKKSGIQIHTLDYAIKDVCEAYKTANANLRAGNIKYFRIRPQKINKNNMSLVIEGQAFSKVYNSFAYKTFGEIKSSEPIKGLKRNARLVFNKRRNKFYLFLSEFRKLKEKKISGNKECSLDPGIRTFQTVYDKKDYNNIGEDIEHEFKPILDKLDKVAMFQGKKWHKKYETRLYSKLKNKINDLHWKAALFLCKKYDEITIGKISTSSVISKKNNLSKKNRRLCQLLSHFTFRKRLKEKCEEYGVKFNAIDESYTTKKCGYCGELNEVGRSKIYKCQKCGFTHGRDFNGTRLIMIKKCMKL